MSDLVTNSQSLPVNIPHIIFQIISEFQRIDTIFKMQDRQTLKGRLKVFWVEQMEARLKFLGELGFASIMLPLFDEQVC